MIEQGNFEGHAFKVFAPGNINGKGQVDEFECFVNSLAEAEAIEAVRLAVQVKPLAARKPSGEWNGPPTEWLRGTQK
jgi:hypothetical protein